MQQQAELVYHGAGADQLLHLILLRTSSIPSWEVHDTQSFRRQIVHEERLDQGDDEAETFFGQPFQSVVVGQRHGQQPAASGC